MNAFYFNKHGDSKKSETHFNNYCGWTVWPTAIYQGEIGKCCPGTLCIDALSSKLCTTTETPSYLIQSHRLSTSTKLHKRTQKYSWCPFEFQSNNNLSYCASDKRTQFISVGAAVGAVFLLGTWLEWKKDEIILRNLLCVVNSSLMMILLYIAHFKCCAMFNFLQCKCWLVLDMYCKHLGGLGRPTLPGPALHWCFWCNVFVVRPHYLDNSLDDSTHSNSFCRHNICAIGTEPWSSSAHRRGWGAESGSSVGLESAAVNDKKLRELTLKG